MSFLSPQFQIISDLHLETPISKTQYETYDPKITASNVLLLGDIGLVKDDGLFIWLRRCLKRNRGTRIFFILGNHEAYQLTLALAIEKLRDFEQEAKLHHGNRFKFLRRDRYDINETITLLGCTLWTSIQPSQSAEIYTRLTDFNTIRGIQNWSLESASTEHQKDLGWLNQQVLEIEASQPKRHILIATHHCPTTDLRASDPAHRSSTVSSAFASDLSQQPCWTSATVKMWAFGHTHYSCMFHDADSGKLVIANQKGYSTRKLSPRIVEEVRDGKWGAVESQESVLTRTTRALESNIPAPTRVEELVPGGSHERKQRYGLFQRTTVKIKTLIRFSSSVAK